MKITLKFCAYLILFGLAPAALQDREWNRSPASLNCLAETLSPALPEVRRGRVTLQGKALPIQIIPSSMLSKNDLSFLRADIREYGPSFDLSTLNSRYRHDVFLGVQSPQHFYLLVDGLRYDARILAPSSVAENVNAQTVGAGLVIRFGFNPLQIQSLRSEILKPEPQVSLSCGQGILNVFEKIGVSVAGEGPMPFRPSEIIERLLLSGLSTAGGKKIPFELFQIGPKSIDAQIEGMKSMTESMEPGMRRFLGNMTTAELELKIKHPLSQTAKESLNQIQR